MRKPALESARAALLLTQQEVARLRREAEEHEREIRRLQRELEVARADIKRVQDGEALAIRRAEEIGRAHV